MVIAFDARLEWHLKHAVGVLFLIMFVVKKNCDLPLATQVQEGQMKELDPSVINAVDLDVPEDILMFTVLQRPRHGHLLKGNAVVHHKPAVNQRQHHVHAVHGFSMELLKNGKWRVPFYLSLCSLQQLVPNTVEMFFFCLHN